MPSPIRREERVQARQEQQAAQSAIKNALRQQYQDETLRMVERIQQEMYAAIDENYRHRRTMIIGPLKQEQYLQGIHYLEEHYGDDVMTIEHSHSHISAGTGAENYTALIRFYPPLVMDE